MKIEIEIDEETAACAWADVTWHGKSPHTMSEIIERIVGESVAKFRDAFPKAVPVTVAQFREALAKQQHSTKTTTP